MHGHAGQKQAKVTLRWRYPRVSREMNDFVLDVSMVAPLTSTVTKPTFQSGATQVFKGAWIILRSATRIRSAMLRQTYQCQLSIPEHRNLPGLTTPELVVWRWSRFSDVAFDRASTPSQSRFGDGLTSGAEA
jgi:hypothetical protein